MTFNRIADSLFILLCAAMAVVTLAMSSLLSIYTVPSRRSAGGGRNHFSSRGPRLMTSVFVTPFRETHADDERSR